MNKRETYLKELFITENSRCLSTLLVLKETELSLEMGIIQEVMRYIKILLLLSNTRKTVKERGFESSDDLVEGWYHARIIRIEICCDLVFSERETIMRHYFNPIFLHP